MNERTLFIEALDIADSVERSAYLERACAGDTDLCAQIEELLSVHDAPGRFMERPAVSSSRTSLDLPPAPKVPGYEILEEIGCGGMGIVYRARQNRLKRTVAIKMLLAGPHAVRDQRDRFRAEAEAVARLHHSNIVQIYEVGDAGDCPFLAIEFVNAGTLKARLSGTPQPAMQSVRFLEIVARAIEYAHQNGVVHRDLKPANILLQTDRENHPDRVDRDSRDDWFHAVPKISDFGIAKRIQDHQSMTACELTAPGAVLGTPSYMAPEQAAGKLGQIGPAADIYALGAMLYELVSGRPPFQGETALDTLQQVKFQEPVPPSRLRPSLPRDIEIICLKCLEKEPSRRYATAAELADDLRRVQAGEPIVARSVHSLERFWRRCRRNPSQACLAAAIALLVAVALGASFWYVQDRSNQHANRVLHAAQARTEIKQAIVEARERRDGAFQEMERPEHWQAGLAAASSALRRAEFLSADNPDGVDEELLGNVRNLRASLDADEQARQRAERLEKIRLDSVTLSDGNFALDRASSLYQEEFCRAGLDVASADAAIVERIQRSPIRGQLVAALDEWAYVADNLALREQLLQTARAVDPDSWRIRFRAPGSWNDKRALLALASDPGVGDQPTHELILLGRLLAPWEPTKAERLLRLAQERRPGDFWANLALANLLHEPHGFQAIGYYRASLAVRPKSSVVYNNLGLTLQAERDLPSAIRCYQRAIELDPNYAFAHNNLGTALRLSNDLPGASAAYHQAIAADPKFPIPHFNLGNAFLEQHDLTGAIVAYREAIALDPNYAKAFLNLGIALLGQKDFAGAVAACQRAIALAPKDARTHYALGNAFRGQEDYPAAVAAYEHALAVDDNFAEAYCNLGQVLEQQGKFAEALAALRKGHRLGSARPDWREPSAHWVDHCQRLIAIDNKLGLVRAGTANVAPGERVLLAVVCRLKQLNVAAVEFYREASRESPGLFEDLKVGARYQAACCAALAGAGEGGDAGKLSVKERADLRLQALNWLRADLMEWSRACNDDPRKASTARARLIDWLHKKDLSGVRDEVALSRLPDAEQECWQQFWRDARALLNRTNEFQ